jgi:transitional endoplasmic reticulum ATPase
MIRKRRSNNSGPALTILENEESEFSQVREKWILRILLKTKAYRDFIRCRDFDDDHFKISIPTLKQIDQNTLDQEILNILRSRSNEIESANSPSIVQSTLTKNVEKLGRKLKLSAVEKNLITFIVIVKSDESLSSAADHIGEMNTSNLIAVIAEVLDLSKNEVREALAKYSALIASGLVKIDSSSQQFSYKVELLDQFQDNILQPNISVEQLMENYFTLCENTELEEKDFDHVEKDLSILIPFLTSAHQNKMQGVNIAIYGDVGIGKNGNRSPNL